MCLRIKAIHYPKSKIQLGQVYMVKPRLYTFPVTFVIIDYRVTNHFFTNQDLFFTYIEDKHKFKTELEQKIITHSYGNLNLEISN